MVTQSFGPTIGYAGNLHTLPALKAENTEGH